MTHEEELIELLDKKTAEKEYATGLSSEQKKTIENTFKRYGLPCKFIREIKGPQVNCLELDIENGESLCLKSQRDLYDELKTILGEQDIRMVLPRKDKHEGHLEVPNGNRGHIPVGEMFRSATWRESHAELPIMMGKSVDGKTEILDLKTAPNLLLAGATRTGKSIFMYSCLLSLIFKHNPDELKMILVDPKMVEFVRFENMPYLQFPVISTTEDTLKALQWLNKEMERRFELLAEADCKTIQEFNNKKSVALPFIVMFIDELADSMMESRSLMELLLASLCTKSQIVGIHLIVATQRLDYNVLTERIKASFPVRIGFRINDPLVSFSLLNSSEAEYLLGRGDMLFCSPMREELTRIQGIYCSDEELTRIIKSLKIMYGDMKPDVLPTMRDMEATEKSNQFKEEDSDSDEALSQDDRKLLLKAIEIVVEGGCTVSSIQRKLKIGYNKACSLVEMMEKYGIVSPQQDNGMRNVLVDSYDEAVICLSKQSDIRL